jgi:large subunit ribosomal protein L13
MMDGSGGRPDDPPFPRWFRPEVQAACEVHPMGSYMAKKGEVPRGWHVVDAENQVVGRLANRVATVLMGKHRPQYTPHVDTGEFVVVVNAGKARFSGKKLDDKNYYRFTGYPKGLRITSARTMMATKPEDVIYLAVRRMLPKTRLGKQMVRKLKIYAGSEHPHQAQAPAPLAV